VLDAEWLAELLEHGLLRASFVPPEVVRQLRDLTRYRKRMVQQVTAEFQRIEKTLEDAGIKLDVVASDILTVSGRLMLKALVAGERDPETLAELSKGIMRKKIPALREALRGRFGDHHALQSGCHHGGGRRTSPTGDAAANLPSSRRAVGAQWWGGSCGDRVVADRCFRPCPCGGPGGGGQPGRLPG
jgi:Transposase